MERIKLAIERAREGHSQTGKPSVVPLHEVGDSPVTPVMTSGPGGVVGRDAVGVEHAPLRYTRTINVPLDDSHLESRRVISHQKTNPATWAFDVLRTQVLQKMDENGWRTLAITSPSVGSGKTLIAVNLALSIANQTNRTALLVDFDLRRPSVAATLGLKQEVSLNEVLTNGVDIGNAMVNPGVERFVVLPTEKPIQRAAELLSSGRVENIIKELRERYDDRVVIFDLPPVLAADDVMAVVPRVDCVLLVIGNGISSQREIEEAKNRLEKANLLGVVLNMDDDPTQHTYY